MRECIVGPVLLGDEIRPPRFGAPLSASDRIVFQGPGFGSGRVLCISKDGATKYWEVADQAIRVLPLCIDGEELVLLKGRGLCRCELGSGRLRVIGTVPYDSCRYGGREEDSVFVLGYRGERCFLVCVDGRTGKTRWVRRDGYSVLGQSEGTFFVSIERSDRALSFKDRRRVVALSTTDGRQRWKTDIGAAIPELSAVVLRDYLVVHTGWVLNCYGKRDGQLAGTLRTGDSEREHLGLPDWVALCPWGSKVLAWARRYKSADSRSFEDEIYSLDLPAMTTAAVASPDGQAVKCLVVDDVIIGSGVFFGTKAYHLGTGRKLWQGGGWDWVEASGGYLYYSASMPSQRRTTVNRVRISTGESEQLYEEKFPSRFGDGRIP